MMLFIIGITMQNKYILLFLLILTFSVYSCSVKQAELSLLDSNFSIDLDKKKETDINLSSFFKNVKTIILENNENCLIGRISEFQVFDGYIYVLDKSIAKSLFVFDMDGRFIRKIGNLGRGPGEYVQLYDFTLDTDNQFIFLLDFGQRVHKYHFDGTFVKTITPKLQSTRIQFIQFYRNKLYLSVESFQPMPNDYILVEADPDDGKILSSFLSLKYNKGWAKPFSTGHSFFMSRLNDPPRYAQLFMDYIVTIGNEITPYIALKSNNLSTDKDLKELQDDHGFETAIMQFKKIWDVHSYVENNDFIIFRYQHGVMNRYAVIYHKKTGAVEFANYLTNDLIFKNDKKGLYKFAFSDTKGAYEILWDNMVGNLQESIRNNEIVPDLDKIDQLMKLNEKEESNPVIFFYEFIIK
jgi:hypothetical protein